MARWRLTQPHYLNVEGTEWEYKETNRETGRQARKVFVVPLYLNPNDPADCNYPGEIVVSDGNGANPRDIVFTGSPTPDMEPLDEEAQAITDKCSSKWVHPIESLPGQGYGEARMQEFMKEIAMLMATGSPSSPISTKGASDEDISALKKQIAELTARLDEKQPAKRV